MPAMTPPTELEVKKWRRTVWHDYQRDNLFSEFMGNTAAAVIHRVLDLKDEGEEVVIPLMALPSAGGVGGDQTLVGNEHDLKSYGWPLRIDWWRDAILLNKKQMRRSVIDQMNEVRPALTQLAANRLRDDIIRALHNTGGEGIAQGTPTTTDPATSLTNINGVYYRVASTAQKNTWHTSNIDRVQYGALKSNYVAGDHAASLANVDSTADKFTYQFLLRLKRIAKSATPKIHPITVEGGREYFIVFAGSRAFRDFASDTTVQTMNRDARARGVDSNPLFQDGDLIVNGVTVREIPEMDDLALIEGAGASSIDVAPVFLCGRQAVGYAVGQTPKPTERKEDDYGFVTGRGVETLYGIGKTQFKNRNDSASAPAKDWGVVTGYVSATDDA
jgi:hypothetical protein